MMKRILTAIVILAVTEGAVHSQGINRAKLDSLFDILSGKDKAMGSLIVFQKAVM